MTRLTMPRRRALLLSGTALAAPMIASNSARAQGEDWPNKAVRYVVPFPAGGPTDTLSRIVCAEMQNLTGQTFIIENKSGNGGVLGADVVAKSAPDGYTIGLYTVAAHAIAPTLFVKMPFDAEKDVTGIAMIWEVPNFLMTRLDFPANTLEELIAACKKDPGKYSFASSGAGTSPHITGELFKQMAGVNILHVPYRGSAPAHQDILAGQVDMMFDNIPGPLGLMKGGKVKGFAVSSLKRHPSVPDKPAITELLPGFEITSWGGFCGPAGMPKGMVEKANGLIKKALESPKVMAAFEQQGATSKWLNVADTAEYRRNNEKRLAPVIKASGAKVE